MSNIETLKREIDILNTIIGPLLAERDVLIAELRRAEIQEQYERHGAMPGDPLIVTPKLREYLDNRTNPHDWPHVGGTVYFRRTFMNPDGQPYFVFADEREGTAWEAYVPLPFLADMKVAKGDK